MIWIQSTWLRIGFTIELMRTYSGSIEDYEFVDYLTRLCSIQLLIQISINNVDLLWQQCNHGFNKLTLTTLKAHLETLRTRSWSSRRCPFQRGTNISRIMCVLDRPICIAVGVGHTLTTSEYKLRKSTCLCHKYKFCILRERFWQCHPSWIPLKFGTPPDYFSIVILKKLKLIVILQYVTHIHTTNKMENKNWNCVIRERNI